MNNKRGKGKSNSQLSLSQSLLRKKTRPLEAADESTLKETEGNASIVLGKTKSASSFSQHENTDFDDSFDLFLPRRSPKKCLPPKAPSSQSSFFEVRTTKKSRYFDDSGQLQVPKVIKDDDLELAIAVSLQESKGTAVNLKPTKAAFPAPRGKLKKACSQSLLMRRSPADRERIITEKVAIVLMNTNKITAPVPGSESRQPRLLYSAFLNEKFNTLNTLWKLSQADFTKIELSRFYTNVLLCYVDAPFENREPPHLNVFGLGIKSDNSSGDIHLALSDEDLFGSSGDESLKGPSPKRPRSDEGSSPRPEINSSPIILHCETEDERKTGSPEASVTAGRTDFRSTNVSKTAGLHLTARSESATNVTSESVKRLSNTSSGGLSLRLEASDLVDMDMETNVDDCPEPPIDCDAKTPLKKYEPSDAPVLQKSNVRRSINKSLIDSNDSRHYRKLSADLISLSESDHSSIIQVSTGSRTLFAHGCIVKARCPSLFDALLENPSCLDEFSFDVCEALFGFIYAGDVHKALALESKDKNQLAECCLRFGLAELAEELFSKCDERIEDGIALTHAETDIFTISPSLNRSSERVSARTSDCVSGAKDKAVGSEKSEVIVLDSDCCSAEEVLTSEAPAGAASDDELDKYLKDGVRLLETNCPDSPAGGQPVGEERSPPGNSGQPKRSIDKYFRDSFPSLDGFSVTPPPVRPPPLETAPSRPTPCSSKRIRDCETPEGQLVVSELATPMPNYESMVTPDLKEALQKYGIKKGIGRRKAVTLLRYIYDQIHPPSDHPAVARAIDEVKTKAKTAPSAPSSDSDVFTLSSESSGDEEVFEDLGDVFHPQDEPDSRETSCKPDLLEAVSSYVKSNLILYAAILKYEPIWLNKFHANLKENGVKCNKTELIDVLDELGITFRTEQTEKKLQHRKNKKPPRRKN